MDFVKIIVFCSIFIHKTRQLNPKIHSEGMKEGRLHINGTTKSLHDAGMPSSIPVTNNAGVNGLHSKVAQRRPLHMAVIGGSNTAGGGVSSDTNLHYNILTNWWNQNVSPITGSHLTAHKIAIGGTGSDFFSFCFQNYLPTAQPDIILVELALNDYGYKHGDAAQPMELLTRRLLSLPSRPLVMYVHFVDRGLYKDEITNTACSNMEDLGFDKLAQHYGIPSFSWREFVCPLISYGNRQAMNTEEGMFNADGSHVSYRAHDEVASKMIEYFTTVFQTSFSSRSAIKKKDYSFTLPPPLFTDQSISDDQLANSKCLSFLTPDWNNPLKQTLSVSVTQSKGFRYISPEENKKASVHLKFRTDAYGSWASKTKGGLLKMEFVIPDGTSRSVVLIYRSKDNGGAKVSIRVWLDEDTDSAIRVYSNKCGHHMYQTRLQPIAKEVSPGYHTLNVQSNGQGWFEVSGLVIGYPGYHDYQGYRPFNVKAKMWSYKNFVKLRCR